MKKSLHVVVYREGLRYVVGDATVEVDENMDIDWKKAEINITNPIITEMLSDHGQGYSLAQDHQVSEVRITGDLGN